MVKLFRKPANEVFLDHNGVVYSVYHGRQTVAEVRSTVERTMKIVRGLLKADQPIRILVDIRDLAQYDLPARLIEMNAHTVLPFWKMAFVTGGKESEGERVSRQLTAMSGRKGEIRYFNREDDAIGWLSFMWERGESAQVKKPTQWSAF